MRRSPRPAKRPLVRKPPRADLSATGDGSAGYSTREVGEILGLPTARILAWARSGLLTPERGARGSYLFSFQDIALLRAARDLLESAIPARRVGAALDSLRRQLPAGRPLSAVRLHAVGNRVLVRDGSSVWEPDSGQLRMDFEVGAQAGRPDDEGEPEILPACDRAGSAPERAPGGAEADAGMADEADDWYDAALDLEASAPPEAEAAYERALDLDPRHADAHLNLGRLLHERGLLDEAEGHYRAAIDADPAGARARYNLGVVLEDQDRLDDAIRAYREALALDEGLATAHFNLARLCERRGEEAEAIRHFMAYRRLLTGHTAPVEPPWGDP